MYKNWKDFPDHELFPDICQTNINLGKILYRNMKNSLKSLPLILLLTSNIITAQDSMTDSTTLKIFNNAIHGSVGSLLGFYSDVNIYYERNFHKNSNKSSITTFIKAGFGGLYSPWGAQASYIHGQYGILTGAERKHHFEASGENIETLWSGSLGYRMQKPGGRFLLRAGAGWPEAMYLGLGIGF